MADLNYEHSRILLRIMTSTPEPLDGWEPDDEETLCRDDGETRRCAWFERGRLVFADEYLESDLIGC